MIARMHMRSPLWMQVFVVLLALGLATTASAQSSTDGAIGGTVTDPSGAVVPGATVSAMNVGTNSKSNATTDASGGYRITHLQPGTYTVEVGATGFGAFRRTNIIVEVGRITTVDVALSVGARTETVTITSEAPVIQTEQPDFSTNINEVFMKNLPVNGRRWSTFALSTPGATADGGFGLVSFRGISGLLNNNTVDGGDNNQAFFSEERGRTRISYSISLETIREFQVNTSNFSAEYGRAAGGVVNAVTKSGTNQFHGSAFYYVRDNALGVFNPFAVQTILVNPTTTTTVPIKPEDRRQQFGGSAGGPILKDRLFFFFSFDEQKRNFPGTAVPGSPKDFFAPLSTTCSPTPCTPEVTTLNSRGISAPQQAAGLAFLQSMTGVVPRHGNQTLYFPKIDWKLTSNHTLTINYNRLRWDSPAGIQTGAVVFRGVDSFGNDFVKEDWGIARLTSTISSHITNELRFQYGRDFEFENAQSPVSGEPVAQTGFSPEIGVGGNGGLTFGKPSFLDRRAFPDERRTQFADTFSIVHGRHLIRFGADINRAYDLEDNLFQEGGAYSYSNRVDFISDFARKGKVCVSGTQFCYSEFDQGLGPPAFEFTTTDLGFFIQDDWHVHPRLTLNLGLRYEYEKMPDPQIPNKTLLPATSVFPNDRKDIGPRVGLAWDLTGKSKSVIRGGYGIYYGRIINSTIANAITNTGTAKGQLQFTILPGDAIAPPYPNILTTAPPPNVGAPDVVVFAPDTRNPMVHEFDVVWEQQVTTNTAISVAYLGTLGRRLPLFLDRNLPPTPTGSKTWTVVGGAFDGQTFTIPFYQKPRPNLSFGRITTVSDIVESKYNALVVQFNRRMTNGLQFQAGYTYSRATDTGQSSQTFTSSNNVLDVNNLALEQGRSNSDSRHRFGASAVWQPNYFQNGSRVLRALLGGYTISPTVGVGSGGPFTGTIRGNIPSSVALPSNAVSTGIFGAGGSNRPPWIPRNGFQAPRTANVNLRLSRSFTFKERAKLEILGEAFNLFNHVNVTQVVTQLYTTGGTPAAPRLTLNGPFGNPSASSNSLIAERQIQLGMRFQF